MRILLDVSMPHEPFNTYVREGTAGQKIGRILEDIHPETAYFIERDGRRHGVIVCEVDEASKVPEVTEPFFLTFDADVEIHVCMTPDDVGRAGLDELGKKWA